MTAAAPDTAVLIAGAGCAGLSLAVALLDTGYPGLITLVEPRREYVRDRTWCFWESSRHPFSTAVTHRWNAWKVSSGGDAVVQSSELYPYAHLPADRFYAAALDRVGQAPNCELVLGATVESFQATSMGVCAQTSAGEIRAGWIFDSRPLPEAPAPGAPGLLQRFAGWHVRTERPCFSPETVGLMEFQPADRSGRVPFLYTLPFSATEALVEQTYFDCPGLPPADAGAALKAALAELTGGAAFEVLYRESGCLPMFAPEVRPQSSPTWSETRSVAIGLRGGRAKPSSGYAFLRIQRHSRLLAQALTEGGPMPIAAEPAVFRTLDRLFLRAIEREPGCAPELFLRLFRRVPADRLIRFLSEESSLPEVGRVAAALATPGFLRAALGSGGAR